MLLFIVAFLYASVGHGGASGYLALMAVFSYTAAVMRPTALILNLFVSAVAFFQYYRSGYFRWNLFWPFAIASVPAAFIGGMITIDEGIYKKILAVFLLISVVRLIGLNFQTSYILKKQNLLASILIGMLIGFLSGMIGIGGGIILSPLLLLFHWADMKETAAVSALFIFVNSAAGLAGLLYDKFNFDLSLLPLIIIAFAGGSAGAYLGANKFKISGLRYILSGVLVIAAVKLLFT